MTFMVITFVIATIFGFLAASFFKLLCFGIIKTFILLFKIKRFKYDRLIISFVAAFNGTIIYILWLFNIGWDPRTEPLMATVSIFLGLLISSFVFFINTLKATTEK